MSTTPPHSLRPDPTLLAAYWAALVRPGDAHEVRIPKSRRGPARLFGTTAGYFDDGERFAKAVLPLTGADAEAVYLSLNPVEPELRARADNHLVTGIAATTADADVVRRTHILIDVDPRRSAGISATDAEMAAALAARDAIGAYLADVGWPDPLYGAMTGNGGALVYRVDLPNDPEALALVNGCLAALAGAFDSEAVTVDQTVGNAARITKVIGTVAAKGDHCPGLGRVWRLATAEFTTAAATVRRDLLEALAARAPAPEPRGGSGKHFGPAGNGRLRTWTVREVLTRKGIGWREVGRPYGTIYELDCCLTSADHRDGAAVVELASGALDYKCHHNACKGSGWRQARAALGLDDPGPGGRSWGGVNGAAGGELRDTLDPVPPFPLETLPAGLRALAEQGAAALVAPADFIAVPLLVAAGAAIGDALELELKPSWREGANLYAATVGDPGSKKSPAMTLAMRPVYRIQKRLKREYDEAIEAYKVELAAWEGRKKSERGPKPESPEFRHVVTTDATTEALAPMLLASKGLILSKDELTGWVRGMDQYRSGGKGADRQHYLSMWSRTLIKVDRKSSREPIIVPRPCLAVVGGIQPDLLPDLADAAQREDGFVDRLLWSYPDKVADRWTRDGVGPEAIQAVEAAFERLHRLEGDVDDDGEPVPRVIRLGVEAETVWAEWYAEHAAESEAADFPRRLRGPWAKMPSQLARLALILHALETRPVEDELSAQTLEAAADLVEYFKGHARRAYRHLTRQRRDRVVTLLQALKERGPLNQRAILHEVFQRNVSAEWLRSALEDLEESGLVTRDVRPGETGRPATIWAAA